MRSCAAGIRAIWPVLIFKDAIPTCRRCWSDLQTLLERPASLQPISPSIDVGLEETSAQPTRAGKYSVAEQSASRQAFGGTGNFGYEELKIADRSLFVVFSYQWHACAGNATSQFKRRKNNWQMIGVESFELNHSDGSGIEVSSSTDLVTGNALAKREKNGELNVSRFKVQPELFLFKNYNGEGSISMHEKKRLC